MSDNFVTWVHIPKDKPTPKIGYHSPLFLPEWAARDFVKVLSVRPERLQDITEEDCYKEGITDFRNKFDSKLAKFHKPIHSFKLLWDSINNKTYPWELNPWCWRIEYVLLKNN